MDENTCCICAETLKSKRKINLFIENSKHSNVILIEILKNILKNDTESLDEFQKFNSTVYSCVYCARKLNEYDYGVHIMNIVKNDIQFLYSEAQKKLQAALLMENNNGTINHNEFYSNDDDYDNKNNVKFETISVNQEINSSGDDELLSLKLGKIKKEFETNSERNVDKKKQYQPRIPYCKHCNISFQNNEQFREHRKTKEHLINFEKNLFKCYECNKRFRTQSALTSHIPVHKTELQLSCYLCGIKFITRSQLNGHLKECHGDLKPFKCEHCDKSFASQSSLVRHQPAHTGEQRYCCDVCGKKFHEPSSFKIHNMMHLNIFTSECKVCGLKFRLTSHLKRHLLTHTGEKPHTCPYCHKAFAMRYNMNLHIRKIHNKSNENIRKCELCNLVFTKKVLFARHKNSNCTEKEGGKIAENIDIISRYKSENSFDEDIKEFTKNESKQY